jgi:hypothetical protein
MFYQMITGGVFPWFMRASLIFLIYDLETTPPSMWVMKLMDIDRAVWRTIGLFLYLLSCPSLCRGLTSS